MVVPELRPGVGRALFARVDAEQRIRSKGALSATARAIESRAKQSLGAFPHRYGTPTPARSGGAPGLISGNLRRSVVHTPTTRIATGWEVTVGLAAGQYPTYGGRMSRTSSSQYGYILEVVGLRNGARYPFLEPAFRWGVEVYAPRAFTEAYGSGWARLI